MIVLAWRFRQDNAAPARALLNWTQETLAHKVGVALKTVRDFENERRKPPQDRACFKSSRLSNRPHRVFR